MRSAFALGAISGNARIGIAIEPVRLAGKFLVGRAAGVLCPDMGSFLRSFHQSILPRSGVASLGRARCGKGLLTKVFAVRQDVPCLGEAWRGRARFG